MQLNVLDDLAEAMKALDGKKHEASDGKEKNTSHDTFFFSITADFALRLGP